MLSGERCDQCRRKMEKITENSWMCQPCKRNVYWFPAESDAPATVKLTERMLQREWARGAA